MAKYFPGSIVCSVIVVLVCYVGAFATAPPAEEAALITEDEEYAVFAAVLFPNKPDAPENTLGDIPRKGYVEPRRVRLDGIPSGFVTLSQLTVAQSKLNKGLDPDMTEGYNMKNVRACTIDGAKLQSLVPEGGRITLITAKEMASMFHGKGGWEEFRKKYRFGSGITYFSRPGFNKARTQAIVAVSHVADPEMGVGYRVYLEKSPKSGKWILTDADLTRRM